MTSVCIIWLAYPCSSLCPLVWSRLVDLVVHPSTQTPSSLLSPLRAPGSQGAPPRSIVRAPELSLLHTPQVVKVSFFMFVLYDL